LAEIHRLVFRDFDCADRAVAADAVQGAYDEDPREWCENTWRNYSPDGVTKGWIMRKGVP